jgi:peroxiredoxin
MGITSVRAAMLAGLMSLALCGCEGPQQPADSAVLPSGYWQAYITLPGGDIETGFELSRDGEVYTASLINGQERVRLDKLSVTDGELLLGFPAFNNEIRATFANGELTGTLAILLRGGFIDEMPFRATPGGDTNQESNEAPGHDLSGRWAVRFHKPDGTDSDSIGEFAQRGSRLFGTFLNPDGDFRFLAGHVRGNEFHMSTFDGAHAFIFSGSTSATGSIENADFYSGTVWHQNWSAERDDNVVLPDAYSRTFLKPGYEKFSFEFPTEEGVMTSLDDEKFQGKVVLVSISGTWCPNCNDEAMFFGPFYEKYHDQGLEIVTLLFEHVADAELAADQVRAFRAKFDIQYDTLVAGISDKTEASKVLPELSAVLAYPTTLFIDRAGRVREIHTGFTGPGTGEHYVRLQENFARLTTTLLAEPADLIEALTENEAADQEAVAE